MQKVIAINLNGNAYQIDESGYAALVAYLEGAERQLADNPDRAEIVADLEQAIAEKCQRFLGPHKTVVAASEVDQIIKEMGPVDGAAGKAGSGAGTGPGATAGAGSRPHADGGPPPRRLYLIHEGSMIAGVCNGLAAYLHVDVTIVRIIVIGLTLLTKGGFVLAYLVLAFVIPPATTSEQRAAAHGQPFNAQELIDRAKENYGRFKDKHDWRRSWRQEHREWKRQWRDSRRQHHWRSDWRWNAWGGPASIQPAGYGTRMLAGFMVPILSVLSVALFWIWIYAMVTLVTTRGLLDQPLPDNVPLWAGILILVFVYQAIAWPLHAARRGSYYALAGQHYGTVAAFDGVMSFGFGILIVWLGYQYLPEVREVIRTLPDVWNSLVGGTGGNLRI
jgi:phage shock protein PspC (stress-responsive transcriptional regulator)